MKYVALLRGINVGGNSKVAMADLKTCLTEAGLENVRTYINSGNVLFESTKRDAGKLAKLCSDTMLEQFGFPINCVVISHDDYAGMVASAPEYWGTGEHRSDALFLIPPLTGQQVIDEVGQVNNEFEWLDVREGVVFWTLKKTHLTRGRLPKIIGGAVYKQITNRSSTTTRKLLALLET
jgi:uncharacterized protein (DUF1697 family)